MAAMTTSNENKAFSVIDEVNDDEVVALLIYNGNGKTPTSTEPTTSSRRIVICGADVSGRLVFAPLSVKSRLKRYVL